LRFIQAKSGMVSYRFLRVNTHVVLICQCTKMSKYEWEYVDEHIPPRCLSMNSDLYNELDYTVVKGFGKVVCLIVVMPMI